MGRPLPYAAILLLLAACGGGTPQTIFKHDTARDSSGVKAPDPSEKPEESSYAEDKHYDLKNYEVSIQSVFGPALKGFKTNVLIVIDKKSHRKDTLEVKEINVTDKDKWVLDALEIKDVTKDIAFDKLAFILDWRGDSDQINSEIIGFMADTLKVLYKDYRGIVDVKRKDKWTLTGHDWGEDPVTRHLDPTYKFTVFLKTLEFTAMAPDTLVTNFDTKATDTIHAFRVFRSGASAPYDIMPGTKLRVDTVFPNLETVIIRLKDSIVLRATVENTELKIKVSDAG